MLASILSQDKSYAYKIMRAEGIDRLDILEVISHLEPMDRREDSSLGDDGDYRDDSNEEDEEFPNLTAYTVELVSLANSGKVDPVIGRESEIDRVMQTLCRRKKNNPLLVGEPGVGKTAIAEGLALKISKGDVPNILKGSRIFCTRILGERNGLFLGTQNY